MTSLKKIGGLIEKNILSLATSKNDKPHQIAVAAVKVLDNRIIITDNFMQETKRNLISNKNVSLIFWSGSGGYELRGKAGYSSSGKWLDFVKKLKENKGFKPKGAIIVKIKKIKKLK
jgi:predicted pyridoxine 5'-phosphate oxidase superfamily flavin-nucleotide-binding protein